jgi:hypothetical protein
MENLGTLAILPAFCFAIYAVIGSVAGKLGCRPFLVPAPSARSIASGRFTVAARLVYSRSRATSGCRMYRAQQQVDGVLQVCFVVGRREGSLPLWAWLFPRTSVLVFQNRRKFREMMSILRCCDHGLSSDSDQRRGGLLPLMATRALDAGDGRG